MFPGRFLAVRYMLSQMQRSVQAVSLRSKGVACLASAEYRRVLYHLPLDFRSIALSVFARCRVPAAGGRERAVVELSLDVEVPAMPLDLHDERLDAFPFLNSRASVATGQFDR